VCSELSSNGTHQPRYGYAALITYIMVAGRGFVRLNPGTQGVRRGKKVEKRCSSEIGSYLSIRGACMQSVMH
jgi:hypothetical protein